MSGRQPLQSTNNLPTSSHKPLVPSGALTKKTEHSVPVRVPGSSVNGPVRVPGFTKPTSVSKPLGSSSMKPPGTSSSGSKPELGPKTSAGVRPQQTATAVRSQPVKPQVQSNSAAKPVPSKPQAPADSKPSSASTEQSLGLEGIGGSLGGSGGKTHRWKLEDFDIGRPLGKVRNYEYTIFM